MTLDLVNVPNVLQVMNCKLQEQLKPANLALPVLIPAKTPISFVLFVPIIPTHLNLVPASALLVLAVLKPTELHVSSANLDFTRRRRVHVNPVQSTNIPLTQDHATVIHAAQVLKLLSTETTANCASQQNSHQTSEHVYHVH